MVDRTRYCSLLRSLTLNELSWLPIQTLSVQKRGFCWNPMEKEGKRRVGSARNQQRRLQRKLPSSLASTRATCFKNRNFSRFVTPILFSCTQWFSGQKKLLVGGLGFVRPWDLFPVGNREMVQLGRNADAAFGLARCCHGKKG